MAKTKQLVSVKGIKNTMYRLRKYGQLEGGKATLDDDEHSMMHDGLEMIQKTGVSEYCRRLSVITGKSADGLRTKYTMLKRYGLLK